MNRDEGQYLPSHVFDDLLGKHLVILLLRNSQQNLFTEDRQFTIRVDSDDWKSLKRSHSNIDFKLDMKIFFFYISRIK